jgi:hypothetical protein
VKIIGYSLSRLKINVPIDEKQKYIFTTLKELSTTCANSSMALMCMDPKLLLIL